MSPPSFQLLQISGSTAASLNAYYENSVVLVLLLSQEAPKQAASPVVQGTTLHKLMLPVSCWICVQCLIWDNDYRQLSVSG